MGEDTPDTIEDASRGGIEAAARVLAVHGIDSRTLLHLRAEAAREVGEILAATRVDRVAWRCHCGAWNDSGCGMCGADRFRSRAADPPSDEEVIPMDLPAPECIHGYTRRQIEAIMGSPSRLREFDDWFSGRTGGICEGRIWDPDREIHVGTGEGPHGPVVYPWDLRRFLASRGREP